MHQVVLKPKSQNDITQPQFALETMQSSTMAHNSSTSATDISKYNNGTSSAGSSQHSHKESLLRKAKDWFKLNGSGAKTHPRTSSGTMQEVSNSKQKVTSKSIVLPVITPPPEEWFACKQCSSIASGAVLCPAGCKPGNMVPIDAVLRVSLFYATQRFTTDAIRMEMRSDNFGHAEKSVKRNHFEFPVVSNDESVVVKLSGLPERQCALLSLQPARLIPTVLTRLVYAFDKCNDSILIGQERNRMPQALQQELDFIVIDCMLEIKREANHVKYIEANVDYWKHNAKSGLLPSYEFKYFFVCKDRPAVNIATLKIPTNASVSFIASILREIHSSNNGLKIAFVGKNFQIIALNDLQTPFECSKDADDSFFVAYPKHLNETRVAEYLQKVPGLVVCKACSTKDDLITTLEANVAQRGTEIRELRTKLNEVMNEVAQLKYELEQATQKTAAVSKCDNCIKAHHEHRQIMDETPPPGMWSCGSYYSVGEIPLSHGNLSVAVDESSPNHSTGSAKSLKSCLKQPSSGERKPLSIGFEPKSIFFDTVNHGNEEDLMNFYQEYPDFNMACATVTGLTALHYASMSSDAAVIRNLLSRPELRVLINATEDSGWTPLHFAALNATPDVAQVLVENGANIEYKNADGKCPIELAEDEPVIEYLKQALDRKLNDSRLVCLHDWEGQEDDEISASAGEILEILDRGEDVAISEWWYVKQVNGTEGFIPRSYVGCLY